MKNEKKILNVIRRMKKEINEIKNLWNGMSKGECYGILYSISLLIIAILSVLFILLSLLIKHPLITTPVIILLLLPVILIECVIKKDKNKIEKEKDENSI